ncbi:O-antigen ligase family protein [Methylobacterium planeticum]|nr:O-antigen ligase family protein [Methylobacterium planeticum]
MTVTQPINLIVGIVLAYLASYCDQAIDFVYGVPPLYGQVVCLAALFACAFADLAFGDGRSFVLTRWQARFIALLGVYAVWVAASFLYSSQSEITIERLVTLWKPVAFMVVCVPLFRRRGAAESLRFACLVTALLGSGLAIYDFFVPTFSTVPGRGAGFYLNPNDAGFMLVALAIVASSQSRVGRNCLLWAVVTPGVFATFSRGAWLMLIIGLSGQALLGHFGGGRGRFIFVGAIGVVLAFLSVLYATGGLYEFVATTSLASYLDPNTVVRLGAYGANLDDASALERQAALELGLQTFYSAPILGRGIGYTFEWDFRVSTHNAYAMFLAEMGLVGFGIYCALLAVALSAATGSGRLLVLLFAFASFFSHNMLDVPGIALVLVLAVTAPGEASRWQVAIGSRVAGRPANLRSWS